MVNLPEQTERYTSQYQGDAWRVHDAQTNTYHGRYESAAAAQVCADTWNLYA